MSSQRTQPLSPHQIRCIAVEAGCDPRTVARFLAGERVVSTVTDRIRRAIRSLVAADQLGGETVSAYPKVRA
jgi:hypothetical protein